MSDPIAVVEGLDFAISLATGQVHPDDIDAARAVAEQARSRVGHLGSTLVLALVGGTGSGKSSLLNGLAGRPIASTSPVRPHTTEPLAWVPEAPEPALSMLLDRLGVERRVALKRFEDIAILDMTDIDSVAVEHRRRVEQLLPDVDVVVWVLDPGKYADPVVHRDFIRPLAGAADRVIFVLNKIDLLEQVELEQVRSHLSELLADDGITDPIVFETAAAPGNGPPVGVDTLATHLETRLDDKRVQIGRIVDEARDAARSIAGVAGVAGAPLGFEERWAAVRTAIVSATGRVLDEPLGLLERLIMGLATDAGGGFGVRIRQTFGTRRIERELRAALAAAESAPDRRAVLDDELQRRFGAPLREILWERASLAAVMAGMAVEATSVERALGRV